MDILNDPRASLEGLLKKTVEMGGSDLHITQTRSWEPAARHYRDLTTEERKNA